MLFKCVFFGNFTKCQFITVANKKSERMLRRNKKQQRNQVHTPNLAMQPYHPNPFYVYIYSSIYYIYSLNHPFINSARFWLWPASSYIAYSVVTLSLFDSFGCDFIFFFRFYCFISKTFSIFFIS